MKLFEARQDIKGPKFLQAEVTTHLLSSFKKSNIIFVKVIYRSKGSQIFEISTITSIHALRIGHS